MIKRYWENTKDLPFPLDMLCQGAMVAGPVMFVFLVVPIVDWTIDGRHLSYAELWKSGAGFSYALFLVLITLGAWGMAARSPGSRWALVVAPIAPYVASAPFHTSGLLSRDDILFGILGGMLMAAVLYACLFRLPAVRRYFAGITDADDRKSA